MATCIRETNMQQGIMVINIQTPKGMDMLSCPSATHRIEKREPLLDAGSDIMAAGHSQHCLMLKYKTNKTAS